MSALLLQLTDLHILPAGELAYGQIDTAGLLQQTLRAVAALERRPDAAVLTGDLVDNGSAAAYAQLRTLLAPLDMPLYLLPGNHDDRQQLHQAFPEAAPLNADGFVQYTADIGGLRLIVLDTLVPEASHGALCPRRLSWLSDALEDCRDRPVVIAMHHPPFTTGIDHMDKIGLLEGVSELDALLRRHPQVQRLLCGHMHRPIQCLFGGTLACTLPSTAHQLALDLPDDAPAQWTMEPPGFGLHLLDDQGLMVSHLGTSTPFAGPFPFGTDNTQLLAQATV